MKKTLMILATFVFLLNLNQVVLANEEIGDCIYFKEEPVYSNSEGIIIEDDSYLARIFAKDTKYSIGEFKITINNRTNIFDNTIDTIPVSSLAPQTISATYRNGDWYRIKTWLGEKWIKPKSYFVGEFKLTILDTLNTYSKPEETNPNGFVNPGSMQVSMRSDGWFNIGDVSSNLWVKPSNFFLGKFKIKLNEKTTIFENNSSFRGTEQVSSLSPQTVTVIDTKYYNDVYGTWFLIESWLGPVLMQPTTGTYELLELEDVPL